MMKGRFLPVSTKTCQSAIHPQNDIGWPPQQRQLTGKRKRRANVLNGARCRPTAVNRKHLIFGCGIILGAQLVTGQTLG